MKTIKEFYLEHKKEILVGVIVFFITTLIGKIFNLISNAAPGVGSSILGLINGIVYSSAAKQSSDSLIHDVTWFGLSFVMMIFISFAIKSIKLSNKVLSESSKKLSSLKIENNSDTNIPKKEKQSEEELLHSGISHSKQLKRISILFIIFTIIWLFLFLSSSIIPNEIWNRFNRDITMITPYTDDKTVKLLQSDWVRMRGKDDFTRIYRTINDVKTNNDLPK